MSFTSIRFGMGPAILLCALLALPGCTRPLTEKEAEVSRAIFGDEVDVSAVRMTRGLGLLPVPTARPGTINVITRDSMTCERTPIETLGRKISYPAAFVLWNRIHWRRDRWRSDIMEGHPEHGVPISHLMLFVHELVHVWQWQNRHKTGYAPRRAALEAMTALDPYTYVIDPSKPFSDYGYEQQARMVEEWLCWRILEPNHPYISIVEGIITAHLPLERDDEIFRARPDAGESQH